MKRTILIAALLGMIALTGCRRCCTHSNWCECCDDSIPLNKVTAKDRYYSDYYQSEPTK